MQSVLDLFRIHDCLQMEPDPFTLTRNALTEQEQKEATFAYEQQVLRPLLEKKLSSYNNDVEQVYQEAKRTSSFSLYFFAALLGHAEAQAQMAKEHATWWASSERGSSVKCKKWAERSAEQKCPRGILMLGLYYYWQNQTEKGRALIQQAAEMGLAEAQSEWGDCLMRMDQLDQAMMWWKKAAEQGDKDGLNHLYWEADLPNEERLYWIEKGIQCQYARAYREMGYYARDVLNNTTKAKEWFEKGVQADDARSGIQLNHLNGDDARSGIQLNHLNGQPNHHN